MTKDRLWFLILTFLSVFFSSCGGGGKSTTTTTQPSSNPAPVVLSVSPSAVSVGTNGVTLRVLGNNFVTSSVVLWNGITRPTAFSSSNQLTASIPAGDLTGTVGSNIQVSVSSPAPAVDNVRVTAESVQLQLEEKNLDDRKGSAAVAGAEVRRGPTSTLILTADFDSNTVGT